MSAWATGRPKDKLVDGPSPEERANHRLRWPEAERLPRERGICVHSRPEAALKLSTDRLSVRRPLPGLGLRHDGPSRPERGRRSGRGNGGSNGMRPGTYSDSKRSGSIQANSEARGWKGQARRAGCRGCIEDINQQRYRGTEGKTPNETENRPLIPVLSSVKLVGSRESYPARFRTSTNRSLSTSRDPIRAIPRRFKFCNFLCSIFCTLLRGREYVRHLNPSALAASAPASPGSPIVRKRFQRPRTTRSRTPGRRLLQQIRIELRVSRGTGPHGLSKFVIARAQCSRRRPPGRGGAGSRVQGVSG